MYIKIDLIQALITEAYDLSDLDYCKILDKNGPIFIGGFVFTASDLLRDAPDYDDNGEVRGRGQMFDESKQQYIESTINKLKADLKAEIDKAFFDEDVIF